MKKDEIHLGDWMRTFLGEVPPIFYVELIIRAFLIYALLIVSMRLLGKRMSSQVSRLELAAMVALASAIGVPMLSPYNGMLPAFIIAIIIVVITRVIGWISFRNEHFEQITQGDIDVLVEDSVMNEDKMKRTRISRERLFAHLRSEKISHLGQVKRLYLEAGGDFSIIENEKAKPGLMVLPEWDKSFIDETLAPTNTIICNNCGEQKQNNTSANENETCSNCGKNKWTKAVMEK